MNEIVVWNKESNKSRVK